MLHTRRVGVGLVGVVVGAVIIASVASGVGVGAPPSNSGPSATDTSSADVTLVTECRLIDEPGHYRLANDIVNSTANRCINIQASDVYFDGAGHTIDGVDKHLFTTNEGVETSTKAVLAKDGPNTNVTVTNVVATDFGYGLWYGMTSNSSIVNNTFRSNGIYGLYIGYEANYVLIGNNVVEDTGSPEPDVHGQGIVVANHAHDSVIRDNVVRRSEHNGIGVHASNRTTVLNNTVVDSGRHGITVSGEATIVSDNHVSQSGDRGINAGNAPGVRIAGNLIIGSMDGIGLARSDEAVVSGNVVRDADRFGIRFEGGVTEHWGDLASPGAIIEGNRVSTSGETGVFLSPNNNDTLLRDNVITGSGEFGVRLLETSGNRLVNNTVTDNRIGVILVEAGPTVLEGNRFADQVEWALLSRRHTAPVTVEDVTLDDGPTVSFTSLNLAVAGGTTEAPSLPEGSRPLSGVVKLWPEPGPANRLSVTLSYDADAVGDGTVGVWVHEGTWEPRPADAVELGPDSVSTQLTGIDGATYVVVAVSAPSTPTTSTTPTPASPAPTPTAASSPTESPGQTGFGEVVALVGLLGGAVLARWRRG